MPQHVWMIALLCSLALSASASVSASAFDEEAQTPAPSATDTSPETSAAPPAPPPAPPTSRERREKARWYLLANYSPMDLLIFPKFGATAGLVRTADKTWELEYLSGSYSVPAFIADLGSLTDMRISVIARRYFGGQSFNLSYGLSYFDTSLHVGDKLLNGLSSGLYPYADSVEIQSLGFNIAIGNRWTLPRRITIGVDWISWEQPVLILKRQSAFLDYVTNENDRNTMENGIKAISYFPRLSIAKAQFGMTF